MEKKRLCIYLGFSFGISWVIFFAYILTGHKWTDVGPGSSLCQLVGLAMLAPAAAMLLTRYVTKEGFALTGEDSMLLGISFKDKKWIWYVAAMLLPFIYLELGYGLTILLSPEAFDVDYPKLLGIPEDEMAAVYLQPLAMIVSGTIGSFAAFGEEAGWRGYMMPKMIKLWGVNKAIICGGIIWGIWHWPLTYTGHNFGRDYRLYPFTGFAAMCLLCIFIGIILTYITYKTGSIWPAAILHSVNNAMPSALRYFINTGKITGIKSDSVVSFLIIMIPMFIIAIFFYVKMRRRSKNRTIK